MKFDPTFIGTEEFPLRASSLQMLVRCPLRALLMLAQMAEDQSGPAADTGSTVHGGVASWHKTQDAEEALRVMRSLAMAEHPLADIEDAESQFLAYALDPRNKNAKLALVEQKVSFDLAPATWDSTGKPIRIIGTLDQGRIGLDGVVEVWDVKTSKKGGAQLLNEHAIQVAAYVIGMELHLKRPCRPGGIIRTRTYQKRGVDPRSSPDEVFWELAWKRSHCDRLMDGVRNAVAMVRRGEVFPGPGEWCTWCPARGLDFCLPMYEEVRVNG